MKICYLDNRNKKKVNYFSLMSEKRFFLFGLIEKRVKINKLYKQYFMIVQNCKFNRFFKHKIIYYC